MDPADAYQVLAMQGALLAWHTDQLRVVGQELTALRHQIAGLAQQMAHLNLPVSPSRPLPLMVWPPW